jgi:hypothetical protein
MRLPDVARFCAGCGGPLPGVRVVRAGAPIWVLVLMWAGTAVTVCLALLYGIASSADLAPPGSGPPVGNTGSLRVAAGVVSAAAASLAAGHVIAAIGLMRGRPWSRPLATLVCATWGLTCVGLPIGLLAISAIWRPTQHRAAGSAPSPPSP